MTRARLFTAFLVAAISLTARPLSAQLFPESVENFRVVIELLPDLQKAADRKPAEMDYINLAVLGNKYSDRLEKLYGTLDKIGSKCEESANRSALADHKSDVLSRTKNGMDKAKALKEKAIAANNDKSLDATKEIKEMQEALTELVGKLDLVVKDHSARYNLVLSEYKDARGKFMDYSDKADSAMKEQNDKRKALEDKARELNDSIDREEAEVKIKDLWDRFNKADDANRKAYGEKGLNRLSQSELDSVSREYARAHQDLFEFRIGAYNKLMEAREKERDAATAYERALKDYFDMMKDREIPAAQELEKKAKMLEDLRKEYSPKD